MTSLSEPRLTIRGEVKAAATQLNKMSECLPLGAARDNVPDTAHSEGSEGINGGKKVFTVAAKLEVKKYLESRKEGVDKGVYPPTMLPSVEEDEYSFVGILISSTMPISDHFL